MSQTVYGYEAPDGTIFCGLLSCDYCAEPINSGEHAGMIALTLSGDESCEGTYYGCRNFTTGQWQVEIPDGCCGCPAYTGHFHLQPSGITLCWPETNEGEGCCVTEVPEDEVILDSYSSCSGAVVGWYLYDPPWVYDISCSPLGIGIGIALKDNVHENEEECYEEYGALIFSRNEDKGGNIQSLEAGDVANGLTVDDCGVGGVEWGSDCEDADGAVGYYCGYGGTVSYRYDAE